MLGRLLNSVPRTLHREQLTKQVERRREGHEKFVAHELEEQTARLRDDELLFGRGRAQKGCRRRRVGGEREEGHEGSVLHEPAATRKEDELARPQRAQQRTEARDALLPNCSRGSLRNAER
jgi:hypothetical protein